MRKQLLIGVFVSAVLLYLVFRNTDLYELWRAALTANYWYFIPSTIATFASFWLRAVRWQLLFASIKKIRIHPLFSATMIGFMANNILPARLGEFVRAYVIGKNENVPKTASFGTIVVERVFDGLVLLCLLITSFITNSALPDWVVVSGYVLGSIYMVTLIVLVFWVMKPDQTLSLVYRVIRIVSAGLAERVRVLFGSFITGLGVLRKGSRLFTVVLMSFVLWSVAALSIYYGLIAFNMNLSYTASLLIMAILGFGVTLPSSPGYIGPFQASCVVALALFSISQSDALSFSIVYHASQYIPVTLVGLIYLWTDHLSLREIRQAEIVA